jgi:phosphohistidine phosphatase SixA
MRFRGTWWAIFLGLLLPAAAWAQAAPAELLQKLQAGGYVLYMRHASTDFSRNDANMRSFEDCDNQRNLTDKGRQEARAIGAHLKRLHIPIGTVLASPYCRTMETARLTFGEPQPVQEVRGGPVRTDDPSRYEPLKKLFSTKIGGKQNLAIASHGNPFHAVAGPPYLAEGEIAVVQPEGESKFSVLGRIRPEDWPALGR